MRINKILSIDNLNKDVVIEGWVMTCRKQKSLSFIKCNDGSTCEGIQIILENIDTTNVQTGCSIRVFGKLIESPAKGQNFEVTATKLEIVGESNPDEYPLAKTRINLETLRNHYHLRMRTKGFGSIFRIRSALLLATHKFFGEENYLHLDPNIITVNECEGGAGVFQLTENDITDVEKLEKKDKLYDWSKDHFKEPVYLTVSSQLQLEALSCALGPVYTTNKSFRSEHSSTNKHVSEFTHLEIENVFIDMEYLMDLSVNYVKFLALYLLDNCLEDLENLNRFMSKGIVDRIFKIKDTNFNKLKYHDAIELLKQSDLKEKPNIGDDLSSDAENWLTSHFNSPVFVTNWPLEIKSFYMKQNDDGTCQSFDLLMPNKIGELIGGSMREDCYDKLMDMIRKKNIDESKMKFYTDLRKFGTVPHGGFGLGFDRLCMYFTGIENIRDVIPFPVQYLKCSC